MLNGAPLATFDLDVVHERSPENIDRLVSALNDLDARYRDPGGRDLRPEATALAGDGHHLLLTRCGPVDVLGLAALIRFKEEAGRDKDRAVLGLLRETLREQEGQ